MAEFGEALREVDAVLRAREKQPHEGATAAAIGRTLALIGREEMLIAMRALSILADELARRDPSAGPPILQ